eukprot:PhM_4_TR11687/c3_g4_i3/m.76276
MTQQSEHFIASSPRLSEEPRGVILSTAQRTAMTRTVRRDSPDLYSLDEWELQVQDTLADRYAKSTTRKREYLEKMITAFMTSHNVTLDPRNARMALEWIGTGTSRRTLYGYATTLRAIYPQLRNHMFDDYVAALRVQSAKEAVDQAPTFSKSQMRQLLERATPDMRHFLWLTWMTASRCSDVSSLEKRCVTLSPQHLIVDFQGVTKATRADPWRLDHLVAIPRCVPMTNEFWQWWTASRPRMPTTTQITTFLRKVLGGRLGPLDKALGNCTTLTGGATRSHSDEARRAIGEACRARTAVAERDDSVRERPAIAGDGERKRAGGTRAEPVRHRRGDTIFMGGRRPTRLPTTAEEHALPVHAKTVKPLNVEALKKIAVGHALEHRLKELLPFVESSKPYEDLRRETGVTSCVPRGDIGPMIEAGLIRELEPHEVKSVKVWCRYFTVVEVAKQRRRIILWPRQSNAAVAYDCDIDLMSTLDHVSQTRAGDWAATFDLAASFYQWPLHESVQYYFGFRDEGGRAFTFQRGVMGFAPMAELMDVAVKILATTGLPQGVRVATHIDNVRFMHIDREKVQAAAHVFTENCRAVGATLNVEVGNDAHQRGTFCGVEYNYEAGTVCLPNSFVGKLANAAETYQGCPTLRNAEILFGCIFHASAVLRAPLADAYYLLKWYRKKMSEAAKFSLGPDSKTVLWQSAEAQLTWLLGFIKKNEPAMRNGARIDLFTDASDWGWGAVLVHDGVVRHVGERWTTMEAARSINEREVMAVTLALDHFADIADTPFRLHIDNTAALWTIASGRSKAFFLNERIKELEAVVRQRAANFTVTYIASEANPADGPSRGSAQLSSLPVGVEGASNHKIKILAPINPSAKQMRN